MRDALELTAIAAITVLATGLGAIPVMLLGERAVAWRAALSGVAIGVMAVAAVVGLLAPAVRDGTPLQVAAGVAIGAGGLFWAAGRLKRHFSDRPDHVEQTAWLTFGVLFVHSLPEGLAIGSAYAASGALGVFVIVAIALQNVPEGTATAIVLREAGQSPARQFWAAVLSSAPQIPGALIAWAAVDAVRGLLPVSFAAAGAAMLLLVATELVPTAWHGAGRGRAVLGAGVGAAAMVLLAVLLAPVG
jgi:ZIP family zinc transporter